MTQSSARIAFHGNSDIKAQCIARLEADLAANPRNADAWRNADALGIPEWLCLFPEQVMQWPCGWSRDFLEAVPVGCDLDAIKGPFLVFVLRCARGVVDASHTDVFRAVDRSIALWMRSDIASDDWLNAAGEAEAWANDAASAAQTRPSWRAGLAAAAAATAEERADGVVRVMDNAYQAAMRDAEARMVADRTKSHALPYDYRDFSDELLRLMKTSRDAQQPSI